MNRVSWFAAHITPMALLLLLAACSKLDASAPAEPSPDASAHMLMAQAISEDEGGRARRAEGKAGDKTRGDSMEEALAAARKPSMVMGAMESGLGMLGTGKLDDDKDRSGKHKEVAPARTRAWFPETFLFAPRVITDDTGSASVDVVVPDRLTTWRILALAQSRNGAMAGNVSTFQSNLPVSVDVVVPPFLVAGDRLSLPIQVVNSTDAALTRSIRTEVAGGKLTGAASSVRVDARGTQTSTALLEATAPGEISIEATVAGEDSVRRTISVESPGQKLVVEKSGTLAAKRGFTLDLEPGVLRGSTQVSLMVFPGALALLRSELASAPDRSSIDDDSYLLPLTGSARALSAKLGAPLDEALIARLTRIAGQRVARRAVSPDLMSAMVLARGALTHAADTLVGRNGEHLAALVARSQRPDGTFAGGDGWPVQRLLVATADGVAAVRSSHGTPEADRRSAATTLRARGAFERFAAQIDDPYTAAVIVASEGVEGEQLAALRAVILAALVARDDGARVLPVPENVTRADGSMPSEIEATAFAVLALHDDPNASSVIPDLGSSLLAAFRPSRGFGDGATNRAALSAVALVFSAPLPSKVVVTFTVNGQPRGTDTLEGARLNEVMTLDTVIEDAGDNLALVVESDPPLPGLSYVAHVDYAVPWPKPAADAGLTLDIELPKNLAVGRSADVTFRALAPGGAAVDVTHGFPAGVDVVRSSLDELVESDVIESYELEDGVLTLHAPNRAQGAVFEARFKVVPTMAGTLHARVASVDAQGDSVFFAPGVWTIATR